MDFSFSEDQVAIRELAYQIFTDRSTDAFQLEFSRTDQAYDDSLWTTLAEQGLLGIGIPEHCGGAGLGLIETCLVLEEQGRRVAPIPLFSSLVLGAMPIIEFGTEAQQQQYLGPLAAGELKLTAAISEIAMPAAIQQGVSATKSDNGWILTGSLDCVLREVVKPKRALAPLLVSRIKVMAKLDIAEKRIPQDGRISIRIGGREIDLRVSTMPSSNGERVVMRLRLL